MTQPPTPEAPKPQSKLTSMIGAAAAILVAVAGFLAAANDSVDKAGQLWCRIFGCSNKIDVSGDPKEGGKDTANNPDENKRPSFVGRRIFIRSLISGLYLDVLGASRAEGAQIVQAKQDPSQQWVLENSSYDGYYHIKSTISDMYLAASGRDIGAPVIQARKDPSQVWAVLSSGADGVFYIQSRAVGLFLDVKGGGRAIGNPICVAKQDSQQVWKFD